MSTAQAIRQQLCERFPGAHEARRAPPALSHRGLPDFPRGALTELTPATPSSGLSLVLARLLEEPDPGVGDQEPGARDHKSTIINQQPVLRSLGEGGSSIGNQSSPPPTAALIDASDSFDPASFGSDSCARLLWVRCRNVTESLRCTDLLLRDGNLPLLVLDLQLAPPPDLRKVPPTSWYRLRNLAEQSGAALLIFTARPLIPCTALHLTSTTRFTLQDLHQERLQVKWVNPANIQALNTSKRPNGAP